MKCATIVAHPDDCVIFAWPLMRRLKNHDWTVIYLTYSANDERAQEMTRFWKKFNVDTVFLGYQDDYRDIGVGVPSFDTESAARDLRTIGDQFDLLLTHNSDGEYGHPHHKFVSQVVDNCARPKIYFANNGNNNIEIHCEETYDTNELVLHQEVIEGFRDRYTGKYFFTEQAVEALGWAH